MEIEYHLTEADILAFSRYRLLHAKGRRNRVQMRRLTYFVGFVLLALGMWLLLRDMALAIAFLALGVVLSLLYPAYFDLRLQRQVSSTYRDAKNRALLANRTLQASGEGLREIGAWGEAQVKWNAVTEITSTGSHTFIAVIGKDAAMVIPRAGVIAGDYDQFISTCRRYKQTVTS